jgi:hypothetical protein
MLKLWRMALDRRVTDLANRLGLGSVQVVIGLLAHAQSGHSRTGARIARALLPSGTEHMLL